MMATQRQLGLLILTVLLTSAAVGLPGIDVMHERIEQINGTNFVDFQNLRVRKFNRTLAVLDGTLEIIRPLDDSYEVSSKPSVPFGVGG